MTKNILNWNFEKNSQGKSFLKIEHRKKSLTKNWSLWLKIMEGRKQKVVICLLLLVLSIQFIFNASIFSLLKNRVEEETRSVGTPYCVSCSTVCGYWTCFKVNTETGYSMNEECTCPDVGMIGILINMLFILCQMPLIISIFFDYCRRKTVNIDIV